LQLIHAGLNDQRGFPERVCKYLGKKFVLRDPRIEAALDPILLQHRDMMFAERSELPLPL
jgi:hypothetical protein